MIDDHLKILKDHRRSLFDRLSSARILFNDPNVIFPAKHQYLLSWLLDAIFRLIISERSDHREICNEILRFTPFWQLFLALLSPSFDKASSDNYQVLNINKSMLILFTAFVQAQYQPIEESSASSSLIDNSTLVSSCLGLFLKPPYSKLLQPPSSPNMYIAKEIKGLFQALSVALCYYKGLFNVKLTQNILELAFIAVEPFEEFLNEHYDSIVIAFYDVLEGLAEKRELMSHLVPQLRKLIRHLSFSPFIIRNSYWSMDAIIDPSRRSKHFEIIINKAVASPLLGIILDVFIEALIESKGGDIDENQTRLIIAAMFKLFIECAIDRPFVIIDCIEVLAVRHFGHIHTDSAWNIVKESVNMEIHRHPNITQLLLQALRLNFILIQENLPIVLSTFVSATITNHPSYDLFWKEVASIAGRARFVKELVFEMISNCPPGASTTILPFDSLRAYFFQVIAQLHITVLRDMVNVMLNDYLSNFQDPCKFNFSLLVNFLIIIAEVNKSELAIRILKKGLEIFASMKNLPSFQASLLMLIEMISQLADPYSVPWKEIQKVIIEFCPSNMGEGLKLLLLSVGMNINQESTELEEKLKKFAPMELLKHLPMMYKKLSKDYLIFLVLQHVPLEYFESILFWECIYDCIPSILNAFLKNKKSLSDRFSAFVGHLPRIPPDLLCKSLIKKVLKLALEIPLNDSIINHLLYVLPTQFHLKRPLEFTAFSFSFFSSDTLLALTKIGAITPDDIPDSSNCLKELLKWGPCIEWFYFINERNNSDIPPLPRTKLFITELIRLTSNLNVDEYHRFRYSIIKMSALLNVLCDRVKNDLLPDVTIIFIHENDLNLFNLVCSFFSQDFSSIKFNFLLSTSLTIEDIQFATRFLPRKNDFLNESLYDSLVNPLLHIRNDIFTNYDILNKYLVILEYLFTSVVTSSQIVGEFPNKLMALIDEFLCSISEKPVIMSEETSLIISRILLRRINCGKDHATSFRHDNNFNSILILINQTLIGALKNSTIGRSWKELYETICSILSSLLHIHWSALKLHGRRACITHFLQELLFLLTFIYQDQDNHPFFSNIPRIFSRILLEFVQKSRHAKHYHQVGPLIITFCRIIPILNGKIANKVEQSLFPPTCLAMKFVELASKEKLLLDNNHKGSYKTSKLGYFDADPLQRLMLFLNGENHLGSSKKSILLRKRQRKIIMAGDELDNDVEDNISDHLVEADDDSNEFLDASRTLLKRVQQTYEEKYKYRGKA